MYNREVMRIWRNWQTRTVQVRVGAIRWRFESSYPHQLKKGRMVFFLFRLRFPSFYMERMAVGHHGLKPCALCMEPTRMRGIARTLRIRRSAPPRSVGLTTRLGAVALNNSVTVSFYWMGCRYYLRYVLVAGNDSRSFAAHGTSAKLALRAQTLLTFDRSLCSLR